MFSFKQYSSSEFIDFKNCFGTITVFRDYEFPESYEEMQSLINTRMSSASVKAFILHGVDNLKTLSNGRFRAILYVNTLKDYEVKTIRTYVGVAVIMRRENGSKPLKLTKKEIDDISPAHFKENIKSYFKIIPNDQVYQILAPQPTNLLEILQSELPRFKIS